MVEHVDRVIIELLFLKLFEIGHSPVNGVAGVGEDVMISIKHSWMIHVVPRRSIILTEIPTILLTQSLVEFIHVPLMAVPHSQEIQHSAQAPKIQPEYLREGDEEYLVSYTENSEPSYLSNNSDNNQTHNRGKELPEIRPLLRPLKSDVFAH